MIEKEYLTKNGKKVKVLKQYEKVVLCLDVENPKTEFWHKEIYSKYVIKIANLIEIKPSIQVQGSLF